MTQVRLQSVLADQSEDVLDDLVEEMVQILQRGGNIDLEECARRFPEIEGRLRKLWPTIQMMANLGCSSPRPDVEANGFQNGNHGALGELGDFQIIREVGRGGMGIVYEAEQISLKRRVALKVLPFAATMDPRFLARFKNEALAAASLDHPHIVKVHAVGQERGVHYFAMQFIDGRTMADFIQQQKHELAPEAKHLEKVDDQRTVSLTEPHRMAPTAPVDGDTSPEAMVAETITSSSTQTTAYFERISKYGIQAAEALEHAHSLGIIHRDIKPGNLILDAQGNVWIADFGLARTEADSGLTMTGDVLGTLRYMSPEQALADHGLVDQRSDIYGLGMTLYELLTLQPAVVGKNRKDILDEISNGQPKWLRKLNRRIPAELETIVLKCIAKEARDRYATARELADDLQRFLRHEPIRAKRPTVPQRAKSWARRHKPLVWSVATVFLIACVLLAGNAGWILNARARQREVTEMLVGGALFDAQLFCKQEDWPEALSAAQRAQGLLAGRPAGNELRLRVNHWLVDLKMVQRLQDIRLIPASAGRKGAAFSVAEAEAEYEKAFENFGINIFALKPDEAANRIRSHHASTELASALDEWSLLRRTTKKRDWQHLLAVARKADPDEWRNKVRKAVESGEKGQLISLAGSVQVNKQLPVTLCLLGRCLEKMGAYDEAETLLRAGEHRYPDDFWILFWLARVLTKKKCPPGDEAIGFYRAARALRPNCTAVHTNLGTLLALHGKPGDAIIAYRKAITINPNYCVAHNNLSWLLATCPDIRFRNSEEAVRLGKEAVEISPNAGTYWNTLGVGYYRDAKMPDAIFALNKSMKLRGGGDGYDWFFLAMAHWQLDEKAKAFKWYERATKWMDKNCPDDAELLRFRAEAAVLLNESHRPDGSSKNFEERLQQPCRLLCRDS